VRRKRQTGGWPGIPPWIIIGAVAVLLPIFVFMTLEAINRQRENTVHLLVEKGAALIRSFEAGARTGMMGMRWGGTQIQRLLTETARQPDIAYLLVTDVRGVTLAHNQQEKIGAPHGTDLDLRAVCLSPEVRWRLVSGREEGEVFEVYRRFAPMRGRPVGRDHAMVSDDWCRQHLSPPGEPGGAGQILFVGLDYGPVEAARRQDMRHTIMMGCILLLVGFAGIVSLLLAQAYRSARTSLSRVRAFSENLVHNMPVGLVAVDGKGRIASVNQSAEAVLGLPAGRVLGRAYTCVLPSPLLEVVDALKLRRGLVERQTECPGADRRAVSLDVIATTLEDEEGRLLGWVLLLRDVSEVEQLKKEIARNQRLATVGRLAAGVAHELRNPLSSIKGLATYFKDRYREVPEDQQTAQIMIEEVDRLDRAIGQLLEFARPLRMERKPWPLKELVEHSLKLMEGDAKLKGVSITFNNPDAAPEAYIDPDKIQQVLLNLFLNALEAMEEGGTLSVALDKDEPAGRIHIVVGDTGVGIRQEDMPHIFDPYFTTKPSGTGLGLAIAAKIVESHDGKLQVSSRYGKGTTVRISLPIAKGVVR